MSESTLPSIEEILQSTDVLSARDAHAKVVRVGRFAVKYGVALEPAEAQSMSFVAEHTDIPVPKVYGTLTEEGTKRTFIVMDMIPGETLEKALPNLTSSEKSDVVAQIRQAMFDLRKIPPADYIGALGRHNCVDRIFWTARDQRDPTINGPFDTENDMNEGMLRKLALQGEHPNYLDFVRTLISSTLRGHSTFFTHGDLQLKNIMVQRTAGEAGKAGSVKITIIDWEMAGWYPEYWEACVAAHVGRFKPEWLGIVRNAMPDYPHEYLMMQLIRQVEFY